MSETPVIPLGPSRLVRVVMTPLTKMLNPLVAALAGRRHFPMAAQIHHVGGIVLVPLTFGNRSDWARNVYAAGQCSVRVNGADYHAVAPQFLTTAQAAPSIRTMFRPVERLVFNILGIRQFMRLLLATR